MMKFQHCYKHFSIDLYAFNKRENWKESENDLLV